MKNNDVMSCNAIRVASLSKYKPEPKFSGVFDWSDETVVTLKKLWAEGVSASRIAAALDPAKKLSRNAVIGKIHRLNLSGRTTKYRHKADRPARRQAEPRRSPHQPIPVYRGPTHMPADLPTQHADDVARVSLMDLEPHHCRWPVGEPTQGFCGCTKQPGSSYCKAHFERSTSNNIKPHTWAHTIGVTAHKNAEEFLSPESVS